jgi:HEPN domain-containing protein
MREIAKEWAVKAEEDYDSADTLLYGCDSPIVATACFHCQHCAENISKLFLRSIVRSKLGIKKKWFHLF